MAALSYASDLGLGQPMAHSMRQTVVALRLAGGGRGQRPGAGGYYYLGLMMNVYCHADAAEQARSFGDDIGMKSDMFDSLDTSTARMVASWCGGSARTAAASPARRDWRRLPVAG